MKPIVYVLELCDTTGEHRPVAVLRSSMPFPPVSAGDRFDDEGWNRIDSAYPPGTREQPRRYGVLSLKHIVTEETEHRVARDASNQADLLPFDASA